MKVAFVKFCRTLFTRLDLSSVNTNLIVVMGTLVSDQRLGRQSSTKMQLNRQMICQFICSLPPLRASWGRERRGTGGKVRESEPGERLSTAHFAKAVQTELRRLPTSTFLVSLSTRLPSLRPPASLPSTSIPLPFLLHILKTPHFSVFIRLFSKVSNKISHLPLAQH